MSLDIILSCVIPIFFSIIWTILHGAFSKIIEFLHMAVIVHTHQAQAIYNILYISSGNEAIFLLKIKTRERLYKKKIS